MNRMRWLKSVWRSGLCGLGALLMVNTAGAFTGVTLGYSWLCVGTAGLLGVPGVALLTVLEGMLK